MSNITPIKPSHIRLHKDKDALTVSFPEACYTFTAEFLRVNSPSAEVQGHGPHQKKCLGGKKMVTIQAIEPVGHYAIRLIFSDGHSTGIYTWDYFADMGEKQFDIWADYAKTLKEHGLHREPEKRSAHEV